MPNQNKNCWPDRLYGYIWRGVVTGVVKNVGDNNIEYIHADIVNQMLVQAKLHPEKNNVEITWNSWDTLPELRQDIFVKTHDGEIKESYWWDGYELESNLAKIKKNYLGWTPRVEQEIKNVE